MSYSSTQSRLCTATPITSFVQCSRFISVVAFVSYHIFFKLNPAKVIMLEVEWIDTYGINHWRIFRSNYRMLAWIGFEPMTTEVHSDALTNWAIRPWYKLALKANILQLLQLHFLFSVHISFWSLSLLVATFALSKILYR